MIKTQIFIISLVQTALLICTAVIIIECLPENCQSLGDSEEIETLHKQPDSIQRSYTFNGKPYAMED